MLYRFPRSQSYRCILLNEVPSSEEILTYANWHKKLSRAVTLHVCDKTLWPKASYGRVHSGLQFRRIRVHYGGKTWPWVADMATVTERLHLKEQAWSRDKHLFEQGPQSACPGLTCVCGSMDSVFCLNLQAHRFCCVAEGFIIFSRRFEQILCEIH